MKNHCDIYKFDGSYGPILKPLLRKLFSQINIPDLYRESISNLADNGHIVFAHSTRSRVDALLLNQRFQDTGLPSPTIIFGENFPLLQPAKKIFPVLRGFFKKDSPFKSGVYKKHISDKKNSSLIFLDRKEDRNGCEPILELLKIQREIDTPIFIVPQRLIYKRSPIKVKDSTKEEQVQLNGFKKIITMSKAEEIGFIEHGEPINLMDVIHNGESSANFLEESAARVRNELRHRIAVLGSNISGAPIRERSFIIKKTMRDPILQSFLRAHSDETGQHMEILLKKVYKNLDQIASDLDPSYLYLYSIALNWIFDNIYDGLDVDQDGLKNLKEWARRGSIVYVPCHKSHIDYLLLSYVLFHNWMSVPFIAAGINLSFFPLGHIFRRGGAFFMRRTFKGNPIYAQTFAAYMRTLLGERIPMEFFIEGTRSRSGKLMLPKKGLLSMIIQAWDSGVTRDLIFVPVYVGYDMVVEEKSYIQEMKGAPKKKENIWELLKARKVLKRRYGKVYVRFAQPISMNQYMKKRTPSYPDMDEDRKERFYDRIARKIISSILDQTVITPLALMASVFMTRTQAMEEHDVRTVFESFIKYLTALDFHLASSFQDIDKAFNDSINQLKDRGLLTIEAGGDEPDLYLIDNEDRIHLEYYKNNVLNCFVPVALIANVLLKNPNGIARKASVNEARSLALLLEKEFILDIRIFENAVEYLKKSKIVHESQGTYYIDKRHHQTMQDFAGLIDNYLESYLVVAKNITKINERKDYLKAMNKLAQRMHKMGEIKRYEALCLPVYRGAIETFKARGYIDDEYQILNEKALNEVIHDIESYLEA